MEIQENVGESAVGPSVPTDYQVMEELSLFARKSDPEDEDTEGVLPRPDHLRRVNLRQEIRESPRGVTIVTADAPLDRGYWLMNSHVIT
jgi:hypothetical protein